MADGEKVIFLAFSNPAMEDGGVTYRGCASCHNKTFTVVHDRAEGFPMMRCACCGQDMGRIGWAE